MNAKRDRSGTKLLAAMIITIMAALTALSMHGLASALSNGDAAAASGATPPAAAPGLQLQASQKAADARQQARLKADASKKKLDAVQATVKQRTQAAQNDAASKLGAAQLRICQNHEKSIQDLMVRIGQRGDNHLELIDTVSERVQQFYADQKLTVDGYDALLAAVTDARKSAQTAVTATDQAQAAFDCSANSPRSAAANFEDLTQARNDAVKAYRDTVKQMIEAVKAAAKARAPAPASTANPADGPGTTTGTSTGPAAGTGVTTLTERQKN